MTERLTNGESIKIENESLGSSHGSSKCFLFLKKHLLILLVLFGVGVGFAVGFSAREADPSEDARIWIGLLGKLYMSMLKMTILPLVVSTIITGTASLNPKDNGRLGVLSLAYIVSVNGIGAFLGVTLFYTFKLGDGIQISSQSETVMKSTQLHTTDIIMDMIRNLCPDNMITACFQKTQTEYVKEDINITSTVYRRSIGKTDAMNILGITIICSVLGIATGKVGEAGEPFIEFFKAVAKIIMTVLNWITWFTPVGVASLIAASIIKVSDIGGAFESLGMYIVYYTTGIIIIQLVLLPLIYTCVMRRSPWRFMLSAVRPWIAGFGPPGSTFAIPEILNALERVHGVDPRVSRFLVPLGATLVRSGSAMFICLSTLFLVKVEQSTIAFNDVIMIIILSIVGSFAVPSVPSSSLITVMIILSSLDVQTPNIGILMALEWYSDRMRTTTNVVTTLTGGILINTFCRKNLEKIEENGKYTEIDVMPPDNILENEK